MAKVEIKTKEPLGLALARLILSTGLIVSAGALIGAVGYLMSHPIIAPLVSVAPNIAAESSPTEVLSMENWQTYRNEEYGFEFKYPNNWRKSDTGDFFLIDPEIDVLQLNFIKSDTESTVLNFVNVFIEGHDCKNLDDPIDGDHIIENENSGIYYAEYCSAGTEVYHYATKLNDDIVLDLSYQENFENTWTEAKKTEILKKIISTFKFIEPKMSCKEKEGSDQSDCFSSYLSQNPDIVMSDDKLKEYFNLNLGSLIFSGISRGKFDKQTNENVAIISFFTDELTKSAQVFIIKEIKKDDWRVDYQDLGVYESLINNPIQMVKNESVFFVGNHSPIVGTCVSVSYSKNIYQLKNNKLEKVWNIDTFSADQGNRQNAGKTNTTIVDSEFSFEDIDKDGNKEIVRQGTRKVWNGYCNSGSDAEAAKIEKINEVYKWNSQKQTFIKIK